VKTALTPDEVLRVAFAHLLYGVDQHALAMLFTVNPGRIAEAVKAIEWAMNNHMTIYKNRDTSWGADPTSSDGRTTPIRPSTTTQ
jgi:hypothetical protein